MLWLSLRFLPSDIGDNCSRARPSEAWI